MGAALQTEIATISLWNFAAIIINIIAFVVLYTKAQRNKSLKLFFIVQISMLIWLVGKVLKTVSPTVELRWLFIVVYYFGICLLEVSFLDFAYIYKNQRPMKRLFRIMIYSVGFIQFLVVATNPYHHLFYSYYDFWHDKFGILFYVHVSLNYSAIILGMIYCTGKFKKQMRHKSKLARNLIGAAILMPLVLNLTYITRLLQRLFDVLNIQVFDITPIVYTWSLMVFLYATFKHEFFGISPIMRHEIITKLNTPLLITNDSNDTLLENMQFRDSFQKLETNDYTTRSVLGLMAENVQDKTGTIEVNNRHYTYDKNSISGFGGIQHIYTFSDVTEYQLKRKEMQTKEAELNKTNEKLKKQIEMLKQTSSVSARNYVARELHDIIGHSLVVTMKLLEVVKIFHKKDKNKAIQSIRNAELSIEQGFVEMKKTNQNTRKHRNSIALIKEIQSLLAKVESGGIKINFYNKGHTGALSDNIFGTVKKVCTELITNTLKHAKATNILLSIQFLSESITIRFMDNGIGSKEIIKGNGLTGIETRVKEAGGTVIFNSEINDGFTAHIVLPTN